MSKLRVYDGPPPDDSDPVILPLGKLPPTHENIQLAGEERNRDFQELQAPAWLRRIIDYWRGDRDG